MIEHDFKELAKDFIHNITGNSDINPKLLRFVESELRQLAQTYYIAMKRRSINALISVQVRGEIK